MFKHCAPKSDDTLLAQFLLSNGFTGTVNQPNEKGIMPLHAALLLSNSGNPQGLTLVQELLKQGANPLLESTDHLKINSTGLAAAHGLSAEFQDIITKCPAAATALSGAGNKFSPLAFAILNFKNHPEKSAVFFNIFKHLVPDLNVNLPNQDMPPLIFAVINDQVEALKYFIDAGALLTVGPNAGWNIAHWAAAFGCFKSFAAICELKPELAVSFTGNDNQWNPLTTLLFMQS